MLDPNLGVKLQQKIEMGIIEGSNILWQQQAWLHITSIISLPRYMIDWCSSPITSILSKLRESGKSSSSSSLPLIAQNLSEQIQLTVVDEIKTEPDVVLKRTGFMFGFFSDMLDNLISYYPVTLVIGEEKRDMFSISLVLTCAVVSCCVTLLVNFLMSRRRISHLWNSDYFYYNKRKNENQMNYNKEREEEDDDRGDFPLHRLSNVTTLNNDNINNAASNGRSRCNMTISSSQSTYNNQNQFQDTFKLLKGEGICSMTPMPCEGAPNATTSPNVNSEKVHPLGTITLNQFPRGNFSPCFEMQGMALETILRLSGIPHVVNCVCDQTGPSITIHDDGGTNLDIWGLQSIFNFLKNNYPDQISSFLTPPEYELQAEFINIYIENRVCWLLYHWRWFYGINCKIKKFAWSNIHKAYIELAASSWNRLFGDTSIDCLVDEILKAFNVLSQLLGEKDYFIHDSICDVDIRIFAVLSQALFSMPCTTVEGLIKAKPNLVNFCHRIRDIAWKDWNEILCTNSDYVGEEGDGDQSFDDMSYYYDNPTTSNANSEFKFESSHHHHCHDEGDIAESMVPKSRTKTKKHSTIPFYCPPEIHTYSKYDDEDSRIINMINNKEPTKEDIIPWSTINNYEDTEEAKEDDETHNHVGTSTSEIRNNNEYYNHNNNHNHQILEPIKVIVGTSKSEVVSILENENDSTVISSNNNNNNGSNNSIDISQDLEQDTEIRNFQVLDNIIMMMTEEHAKKEKNCPNINNHNNGISSSKVEASRELEKIEGILDIKEPYFDFELIAASSSDKIESKHGDSNNNNNNNLAHGDQSEVSTLSLLRNATTNNNNDNNVVCSLSITKLKKVANNNNNKSKIPVIKR